jgi:nitrite reductase/ring-hydroxylating ferredoxin subunit
MKKYLILLFITSFFGCDKEEFRYNNPYLPNYPVNLNINMNLPQYSNLLSPANAVYINAAGQGIRGIIVFNTGSGYVAYDAACPNQALASCSTMTISGIDAICPCDEVRYSLFSGQAQGMQYPMKRYRVEQIGEVSLRVYN